MGDKGTMGDIGDEAAAGRLAAPSEQQAPRRTVPLAVLAALGTWATARRQLRQLRQLDAAHRAAVVLLVLAAIYRIILIARGWPSLDSDQAIIGLMARHILQGERPIFFWGQQYMGAFEAYFAAPIFAVFGASTFTLHLSALLLVLGFLAAMYFVGRAAFGPVVGVLTLAWLAFGPAVGLLRELAPIGGYQEMLLFAALIVLGVWDRLRQPDPVPRTRRAWVRCLLTYLALGLLMGVGLWSDLLMAPVLVMAVLVLLGGRWRELFSRAGVVLLLAFVLGAWPFLSYNVQHPNATYKEIALESHAPGQTTPFPALDAWADQLGATLSVGLPSALGSPRVCVKQGDIWGTYPPQLAAKTRSVGDLCDLANTAFSLVALALFILAAVPGLLALRRWWLARQAEGAEGASPAPPGKDAEGAGPLPTDVRKTAAQARLWLVGMLVGIALLTIFLYTTNRDANRYQFTSSRYLLLLYVSVPVLIGTLWQTVRPLALRLSLSSPFANGEGVRAIPEWLRGARGAVLATFLAFSLVGGAFTLVYSGDASQFAQPTLPQDQQILAFLGQHGITRYYSDYWTCYRIAFEADERVICAVRGEVGRDNLRLLYNRNDAWVRALAATPHPAYIYPAGSVYDQQFAALAAAENLPHAGYARVVVAGYAIHYYDGG